MGPPDLIIRHVNAPMLYINVRFSYSINNFCNSIQVLEDKENIFRDDKGKQILKEFKEKITSSYLPRKKGVYSYQSKMSEEERDKIMSQLGIEVKYLKKDEVIEWMLN